MWRWDPRPKQPAAGAATGRQPSAAAAGFTRRLAGIAIWLTIGCLTASLALSLHPAAAEPSPLVAGRPARLPLIEGKGIRFTHLSTEQGLSQSRVDHILQDRRGFIWIGTYNGLNRYDGYHFKTYKPDPNNPNSLGGLIVFSLFEDRSGILWIGLEQGLDRFDPATERFTHFRADPVDGDALSGFPEHITQDRDGMLWLATHDGLDRLDPASGRFTRYRNDPNDPHTLSSNDVRFVLEDRQDTLWVATVAGLNALDRRTGRVRRYPDFRQPALAPLDRILQDRSGMLWLSATRGGGLASLDPKTGVFMRYTWFEGWPGVPGVRGCSAILEDRHGMLWLATKPDGVVSFDRARRLFTRYRNDPVNPASLNDNEVLSLLEDRERGMWVGASAAGVNRFSTEPSPFTAYRREPANPNSLAEGALRSVLEDSEGILWMGTAGQLSRLDRKTERYTFYRHDPANPESIAADIVQAIVEDHAGFLWFGTARGGLNRFDRRTGRFRVYRHDPANSASLSQDDVISLLVDHRGGLWVGTEDGLNRLDASAGRFTVFRPKSNLIESRWYRVLAEGADGSIWMGTYTQGLQRLDLRTGEIVAYKNDPQVRGSLSNNRVTALLVDRTGTLWVGTQNGLNRFDRNTGEFTIWGERDGLPNDAVKGILEDAAGRLWLSTGNGLSRFDPRTGTFKNYYSEDGLGAGDEFIEYCAYKGASGEMFFGGVNGVTAFYPENVIDSPFAPPLVLTDFRLFNDSVGVGGKSPLQKSISYTDSLTLSHDQNIFSLEFAALGFSAPTRTRYRYRLEGLETQWNERPATHRLVTCTTLAAADYRFRVQSQDNAGRWNEPGLTLAIRVLPAWWNTWQFRTVWIASLLLLTWFLYQLRIRQLQHDFKKLQDLIETIPAMAWTALPDGSNEYVNRRWAEYTGLSARETAGSGWTVAVHPEDLQSFGEKWRASVATREPFESEARFRCAANGEYHWLLASGVPLRDKHGNVVRWYGILTDIEDRKRAEQEHERLHQLEIELAHTNRVSVMGELTASISHEISQPLTAIATQAAVCLRWLGVQPPHLAQAQEAAEKIARDSNYAGEVIQRVRALFKRASIEKVELDLNEVIDEALELVGAQIAKRHVALERDLGAIPHIMGDRVQLQQVILNLVVNGLEAMDNSALDHPKKLVVRSRQESRETVIVEVQDTGIGVQDPERIFDSFFTTKKTGTGLGLPICRNIIKAHGGNLWVVSREGPGTIFRFTLPVQPSET